MEELKPISIKIEGGCIKTLRSIVKGVESFNVEYQVNESLTDSINIALKAVTTDHESYIRGSNAFFSQQPPDRLFGDHLIIALYAAIVDQPEEIDKEKEPTTKDADEEKETKAKKRSRLKSIGKSVKKAIADEIPSFGVRSPLYVKKGSE